MSSLELETFITEIQRREILWNKTNLLQIDRQSAEKQWNALSKKTGLNKDDAKKKWRNLRDQFLKEFKKLPQSPSTTIEEYALMYTGRWQHFCRLLFLKDAVVSRHLIEQPVPEVVLEENLGENEVNFGENGYDDQNFEDGASYNDNIHVSMNPHKRQRLEEYPVAAKLLDVMLEKLNEPKIEEDENILFLRSLHPYLEKLNPIQQLRVRNKFQQILLEEVIGNSSSS